MQERRGSAGDGQGTPFTVSVKGRRSSPPKGEGLQGAGNSPAQKGKEVVSVSTRGP